MTRKLYAPGERHLCVLLHGIEYDPSEVSWVEDFYVDSAHRTDVELFPENYGQVSGWKIWMFSSHRNEIVRKEVEALKRIKVRLLEWDSKAKFSIFAHSLGGTIVQHALREIKFHNVILMMAAMDENFDWRHVDRNFNRVFVYYSPNDEMLGKSYWGKQGLVGPTVKHPRVEVRPRNWTHDQFMDLYYMDRTEKSLHNELLSSIEAA